MFRTHRRVFFVGLGVLIVAGIGALIGSFRTVDEREVGYRRNALTGTLDRREVGTGTHLVGPAVRFVIFGLSQRTRSVEVDAFTKDTIPISIAATCFFTLQSTAGYEVALRHGQQDEHDKFVADSFGEIVRREAAEFTAKEFYRDRAAFTLRLNATASEELVALFVSVNSVQVAEVVMPPRALQAMARTNAAQQDIATAESEHGRRIMAAEADRSLAAGRRDITLSKARTAADVVLREGAAAMNEMQARMAARRDAFTRISDAMGLGGEFFVQHYMKNILLQSTDGKVIFATPASP